MFGKFHWNEFLARDLEKAKDFYANLMGWETEVMAMPEGGDYVVFKSGGEYVAGMMDLRNTFAPEGTPPHWYSYLAVEDVDASCKLVEESGGQVMRVFDVPNVGRIALVQDADGGHIGLMTPAPM